MPAPPRLLETIIGLSIPPACREPVLGDLHERYRSTGQYLHEAMRTVPLVILSRIRRTTDPQLLLMEAFALYLSFVTPAWWLGPATFLYEDWGLLRLAVPTAVTLMALILVDAYANPARPSMVKPALQAAVGISFALLSQAILWITGGDFAVPWKIMLYGTGGGLILISALRVFFAAPEIRPRGGA